MIIINCYSTDMKTLDWNSKQAYAKTLSNKELLYAIKDCIETANANKDNEGYYHDEASVYRAELVKRKEYTVNLY